MHTHTGDHIKLRALGLAEPHSHSRNLPALLTSVSIPEKSSQKNTQKQTSLCLSGLTLSHLQSAGSDSELQWICEAEPAWLSHQSALLCFDPSRTCINWCYHNDTLAEHQVFLGLSMCWSYPPAPGYVCAIRVEYEHLNCKKSSREGSCSARKRLWSPTCGDIRHWGGYIYMYTLKHMQSGSF